MLLVTFLSGCGGSDNGEAEASSTPSATATVASPSASATASYVSRVNGLCESMIPKVMAVRGDKNGDGGGDIPTPAEYEGQEARLKPIVEEFDAAVAAIPVTDKDRPAADAFDAYRKSGDAESDKILAAAKSGDQQTFEEAAQPSAEFEAKRRAMEDAGISCPAR